MLRKEEITTDNHRARREAAIRRFYNRHRSGLGTDIKENLIGFSPSEIKAAPARIASSAFGLVAGVSVIIGAPNFIGSAPVKAILFDLGLSSTSSGSTTSGALGFYCLAAACISTAICLGLRKLTDYIERSPKNMALNDAPLPENKCTVRLLSPPELLARYMPL